MTHAQQVYALGLTLICAVGTLGFIAYLVWLAVKPKERLPEPSPQAEREVYREWT